MNEHTRNAMLVGARATYERNKNIVSMGIGRACQVLRVRFRGARRKGW